MFYIRYSRLTWIYFKRRSEKIDNLPIRIYVNKIEKRIKFRIKTWHYLQLLTPGTMKLLGTTKNKITKDKPGENVTHIEITEVVLVHCNINPLSISPMSSIIICKNHEVWIHLFQINHLVVFLKTFKSEFQETDVWFKIKIVNH